MASVLDQSSMVVCFHLGRETNRLRPLAVVHFGAAKSRPLPYVLLCVRISVTLPKNGVLCLFFNVLLNWLVGDNTINGV